MRGQKSIGERSKSQEFEVPDHVITELSGTAGDVSQAASLISEPAGSEQTEPAARSGTEAWAIQDISEAIESWHEAVMYQGQPHWDFKDNPVPTSFKEFKESHQNFNQKFRALCKAKKDLTEFGETPEGRTPEDNNIGDDMHFLLIPWGYFAREITQTAANGPSLKSSLIELHGFNDFEMEAVENLKADNVMYRLGGSALGPEAYLNERIAREGPWGMMLAQTSYDPGLMVRENTSPSFVSLEDSRQLSIAGQSVSALGIFEEMAFSLQIDKFDYMAEPDSIWLPANSFSDDIAATSGRDFLHPNMSHDTTGRKFRKALDGILNLRQLRLLIDGEE